MTILSKFAVYETGKSLQVLSSVSYLCHRGLSALDVETTDIIETLPLKCQLNLQGARII